jgi:hypothetical protein
MGRADQPGEAVRAAFGGAVEPGRSGPELSRRCAATASRLRESVGWRIGS